MNTPITNETLPGRLINEFLNECGIIEGKPAQNDARCLSYFQHYLPIKVRRWTQVSAEWRSSYPKTPPQLSRLAFYND
jgi:hypothetical protein